METFKQYSTITLGVVILSLCSNHAVQARSDIKIGYCAYGSWPKDSVAWYSKNAQLIVAGERKKEEIKQIKRFSDDIKALLYKISLNKENPVHGVDGYAWINKNHGGKIGKVVKDKKGGSKGVLHNNKGEIANFLDTRETKMARQFVIQIDGGGKLGQATFKWSSDGGVHWNKKKMKTGEARIKLIDGIAIWFSDGGFKEGDRWFFMVQDSWFLLDDFGQRMTDQYNENSKKNVFWMDWGNSDWQEYWVEDVVESLNRGPWDGVMADCGFVNVSKYWAPNGVLQYKNNEEFNAAVESFYEYAYNKINAIGKMLIPNSVEAIDNWDQRLEYTHGGLDEGFVNISRWSPKRIWRSEMRWEKQIRNLEKTCDEGKIYFAMAHNQGLNEQDLLFNLASFLLGTDGKHGYFYNEGVRGYEFENYLKDYNKFQEVYELQIGAPEGKRYYEDNVWKRRYQNGLVIANPYNKERLIELDAKYYDEEGKIVNILKLNSHEGKILLRNNK